MAKIKKANKMLLGALLILVVVAGIITYVKLNKPSTVFAATCSIIVDPGYSINSAINRSVAGATICVSPGDYTENIKIAASKTGLSLISVKKHQAKIIGTPRTTERVAAIEINANNVTISGFDVTGPDIKLGIADEGANNLVTGNYVHDIAKTTPCDSWGGAGIEHGNYQASNTNGASIGNFVENISPGQKCPYNQGIYHSQPTGRIINNIVKNVDAFCIHLWHSAHSNYQIYNNLVIGCGKADRTAGITIGADPNEGVSVTGSTIANNIVMDSPRGIEQNNASGNFYRNNIIFGSGSGQELTTVCSNSVCENNRFINPQLDTDYRPLANSPVIDMGYVQGAPTTDYDNKIRVNLVDIGPYEFDASAITPTPSSTPTPTSTPSPTPSPTPTPTSTPTPQPTATPQPTTQPTPTTPVPTTTTQPTSNVVSFDGAPLGPLRGKIYPLNRSINWLGNSWLISPAWGKFTTRNLSFRNSTVFQGTFTFATLTTLKSFEAYNGGTTSSTIRIICGSQVATSKVGINIRTTIATGFTSACQTVTLSSTNGWDTNFDNLTYK